MAKTPRDMSTDDILATLQRMVNTGELDRRRLLRQLNIRTAGRPPKPQSEKRTETVTIRLTAAEKRHLQRTARDRKTTLTNLLLSLAMQA